MNAPNPRRTLPYTWIALGVFAVMGLAFWTLVSTGIAQMLPGGGQRAEVALVSESLERELSLQSRLHRDRIERLAGLKESLGEEKDDRQLAAAIDRLIEEEQRRHRAHAARLQNWMRTAEEEAHRLSVAEVRAKYEEFARTIDDLDQSIEIPPVKGHHSSTGGTHYVDPDHPSQKGEDGQDDEDDDGKKKEDADKPSENQA